MPLLDSSTRPNVSAFCHYLSLALGEEQIPPLWWVPSFEAFSRGICDHMNDKSGLFARISTVGTLDEKKQKYSARRLRYTGRHLRKDTVSDYSVR